MAQQSLNTLGQDTTGLDGYLRGRIRKVLENNFSYFTERIKAVEMLEFFPNMPTSTIENIQCRNREEGNVIAVRLLIREMQRYSNFAFQFLRGLHMTSHESIARELLEGSRFENFRFVEPSDGPPTYQQTLLPEEDSISMHDQEEKINFLQTNQRNGYVDSSFNSLISDARSDEVSLSHDSSSAVPSIRDDNDIPTHDSNFPERTIFTNINETSSVPTDPNASLILPQSATYSQEAVTISNPNINPTSTISTPMMLPQSANSFREARIVRAPVEHGTTSYQSNQAMNAMSTQQYVDDDYHPSDIRPDEVCISEEGSMETTFPKRVVSVDSNYVNSAERQDAIVPNPSAHLSYPVYQPSTIVLNQEGPSSIHVEDRQRVIEEPNIDMKTPANQQTSLNPSSEANSVSESKTIYDSKKDVDHTSKQESNLHKDKGSTINTSVIYIAAAAAILSIMIYVIRK